MQTNQLFLVISDSGKISPYLTATHISIENWTFDLSPASWSTHPEHKTILIFKFYKQPLRQLVGNSSQWSMPTVFNSSIGSVQQSITTIINDADNAITKAETQNYQKFVDAISDANLSYPWYGLIYELDLGSVGALAGKIGLTWSMIVAWSPNPNNYQVYLGLKLPGSSSGKTEVVIQGVIKIMFQRIIMIVNDPGDGSTINYVLLLKNIQLKFLSLSLPPKGQTEIVIFGASTAGSARNTLGWYAAYAKQAVAKKPAPPDPFKIDSPPSPLVLPAPTHEEA